MAAGSGLRRRAANLCRVQPERIGWRGAAVVRPWARRLRRTGQLPHERELLCGRSPVRRSRAQAWRKTSAGGADQPRRPVSAQRAALVTEPFQPEAERPPKVDAESLVLRGSPRRVTRFRRGLIIAIAAA